MLSNKNPDAILPSCHHALNLILVSKQSFFDSYICCIKLSYLSTDHTELRGHTRTVNVHCPCPIFGHTEPLVLRVSHKAWPHRQLVMSAVVSGFLSLSLHITTNTRQFLRERERERERETRSAISLFVCALAPWLAARGGGGGMDSRRGALWNPDFG